MKKEHSGPPPMKWKGQHIFPFGLCVKEMKSRFSSRPPSLPPVRNLTEFGTKTGSWSQIGVHGLKIGQIFAKFQRASFLIRNNVEK